MCTNFMLAWVFLHEFAQEGLAVDGFPTLRVVGELFHGPFSRRTRRWLLVDVWGRGVACACSKGCCRTGHSVIVRLLFLALVGAEFDSNTPG